jgi:glutamate carboxypeptidase
LPETRPRRPAPAGPDGDAGTPKGSDRHQPRSAVSGSMAAMATGTSDLIADHLLADLRALVEIESPSDDVAATERCLDVAAQLGEAALGRPPRRLEAGDRRHLLWPADPVRVLVLGHLDTVWPIGTLDGWPFSVDGDRATGPGVFDMKAGVVQVFAALAGLDADGVAVLLTSDEEIGSTASRLLIETVATGARAALVAEPSAGGALKAERKGIGLYRVDVHGRAAHAGLDPERGVNALLEAARIALALADLADPAAGTTVTPSRLRAGTTVNTVPASATLEVDVRVATAAEQDRVDAAVRALTPVADGARIEVSGGPNRPPLPAEASRELVELAAGLAVDAGIDLPPAVAVGGGSDGNLTAALGVPTLDGLGAVGGNAHAEGEWVHLPSMAPRARLLRMLVEHLA